MKKDEQIKFRILDYLFTGANVVLEAWKLVTPLILVSLVVHLGLLPIDSLRIKILSILAVLPLFYIVVFSLASKLNSILQKRYKK